MRFSWSPFSSGSVLLFSRLFRALGASSTCCSVADRMIAILAAAQSFFAEFASRYSDEVLWSRGDHVSRELHNSAAYAWPLPRTLEA